MKLFDGLVVLVQFWIRVSLDGCLGIVRPENICVMNVWVPPLPRHPCDEAIHLVADGEIGGHGLFPLARSGY